MTTPEIIFILIMVIAFFFGWLITCHLYSLQADKNKDLQLENTDLIARNLSLQGKVRFMNKRYDILHGKYVSKGVLLKKKKELLEIQDSLLNENNIKH